jgi:branched-chain amino acid transport system permease protein
MAPNGSALRYGGYALIALGALLLPFVLYPVLALDIVLWGLFAVAVDLLLGYGGLLSFGHAAFWGGAAYAAGIAAKRGGLPFPVAVLIGTAVAILLALPIGYLSIRRQGIYFAMVTLAFAQMVFYVINQWRSVTGGENGIQSIPRTLLGLDLSDARTFYYCGLAIAAVGYWIAWRAVHSPFGHVLVAIRDNEARAQALGYPTRRYKLTGFVLSAGLAGLAGSLFALSRGLADQEYARWTTSGLVVIMAILGGIGTLWGGVIGALIVLVLRDWLTKHPELQGIVTGAIFAVIVLGFRRGILGSILHWRDGRRGTGRVRTGSADEPARAEQPTPAVAGTEQPGGP